MVEFVSVLLLLAVPASVSEDCFDDAFCVEVVQMEYGVRLEVRSLLPGSIAMRLELELENMQAPTRDPILFTLPGRGRFNAVTLTVEDRGMGWSYRYGVQWTPGTLDAQHDPSAVYELPYARGDEVIVGQGYNGSSTHQGEMALDFDLSEGERVLAARAGRVVAVEDKYREGGMDPALRLKSNRVSVEHDDGTVAEYVHLQPGGVFVEPGQTVHAGDLLGRSGHTGYASGPHLHFEVYGVDRQLKRVTLATPFRTSNGVQQLRQGRRYRY